MSLPVVPMPTETVKVGDADVTVRGLTVSEVRKVHAAGETNGDALAVSYGVGCTVDEAQAWLDSTPADVATAVMTAIMRLSGLLEGAASKS
jgi:hypothetical protein